MFLCPFYNNIIKPNTSQSHCYNQINQYDFCLLIIIKYFTYNGVKISLNFFFKYKQNEYINKKYANYVVINNTTKLN